MREKILITEPISSDAVEYLKNSGFQVLFLDNADINAVVHDCDAIIVRRHPITKNIIDNAKKLRIIAKHGVGLDAIDVDYAKSKGIQIINTPGINAVSVAEHTIMLMLACAKKLNTACYQYKLGNYGIKDNLNINELSNKKLGLIGYGNVAKKVANIANMGFNMNVSYYDPYVSDYSIKNITKIDKLEFLLSSSDFVSIHIPGNVNNSNMLDASKLKMMKKNAFLINTSRGSVVNQFDLIEAINNHIISGAGLDVCNPEPAEFGSKILNNDNIIITPHCAASSNEVFIKTGMEVATKICNFFNTNINR